MRGGSIILKVGLIGVVAVFLALVCKKEKNEYSILITLAAGTFIFILALSRFSVISDFVKGIWDKLPIEQSYLIVMFKMLGIAYIADFACGICKDNGYQAVAGQIETFAKLSILVLCIPGIAYLMKVLENFL